MRPACLVTSVVSDYREEPFRMLAEAEGLEVLAFADGGREHAGLAVRHVTQRGAARLVASGRYRAVICGLGGRVALPATYLGARRAGVPFVLWASVWSHPRTPAHALSWLPTRRLYRRAGAVATYGPHVSRYVAARRGTSEGVFEATQAVSAEHFGRPISDGERRAARERAGASEDGVLALFVGRLEREKGVPVLLEAWRQADLGGHATLAIAGEGSVPVAGPGIRALGKVARNDLPALYAAADLLVLPSVRTATFTEPWGLVCNEAMHQSTPIVATDAVGAVVGGLVKDGRNGLVVPERDAAALAARLRAVAYAPGLRARLGAAAHTDVGAYTYAAWVNGMRDALAHASEHPIPRS
ncbi:MAG: glycosyltransferase family 4 protein [Thermoleophilaceae bacterium]